MKIDIVNSINKNVLKYLKTYEDKFNIEFSPNINTECLEIYGTYINSYEKENICIVLRLFIVENEIHISNIFIPDFMKHNGIGKNIIKLVYETGKELRYYTLVIDMVPGFYNRLKQRNALPIEEYDDALVITEFTNLG